MKKKNWNYRDIHSCGAIVLIVFKNYIFLDASTQDLGQYMLKKYFYS